jgi:hypothetical protein
MSTLTALRAKSRLRRLAETTNGMVGILHAPADAADWPDLRGPASFRI